MPLPAVGSTCRRLSFFLMVLCHSRPKSVEFAVPQTSELLPAAKWNVFAA